MSPLLTPLYRAFAEQSLSDDGVLEPAVTADGMFLDDGADLLDAPDGPALVIQALAAADAVMGTSVGREVVKTLAQQLGLLTLEGRYDQLWGDAQAHNFTCSEFVIAACERAASLVRSQPGA